VRTLQNIQATAEQLPFISDITPGTMVIRGAAGSGKTSTAILRLNSLLRSYVARRARRQEHDPVRALVLTYNRTLRGYIAELVERQRQEIDDPAAVELDVSTFAKWSRDRLNGPTIVDNNSAATAIRGFGQQIALPSNFLIEETEYALGRFLPDDLSNYVTATRVGRGATPRVEQAVRQAILADVIGNYAGWKAAQDVSDFNDLAVQLAMTQTDPPYDIIVADECQDFSGNQLRAIYNHLKPVHSLTLVIDSAQRIYVRGFTWRELGLLVRAENIKRLQINYRNTREIAQFALPLVAGLPADEDATLPDFTRTTRRGRIPVVLKGRFSEQMRWAVNFIRNDVDLANESVAFLHPLGGGWFNFIRQALGSANLDYVELTRQEDWPSGDENIALVTCHSAKGLEFDHVFMLGLNEECVRLVEGDEDREAKMRRLIAMGIGRARNFVCIGYRPDDPAAILEHLDEDTYERVDV
jgi:superfamily I DNA/RNA helicase